MIDMGNTTTNVMGDMVGTAIVAHSERMAIVAHPKVGTAAGDTTGGGATAGDDTTPEYTV